MAIAALIPLVGPILDKVLSFIPDPNARQKAKEQFERELLNSALQQNKMQVDINVEEAKHGSIFVAGWRPWIGWVCGAGVCWEFVIRPLMIYCLIFFGDPVSMSAIITNLPQMSAQLFELVLAMLGMSGLRTYEKMKGLERNSLK